jgi:NAD(P)-dependent dehydrogenase (short-subunit alcohol dehydrogenase family)
MTKAWRWTWRHGESPSMPSCPPGSTHRCCKANWRLARIAGISHEQILRNAKKKLPLRRFAIQGDEVAAMVRYLASPQASGVTAQSLMIDGGAGLGM